MLPQPSTVISKMLMIAIHFNTCHTPYRFVPEKRRAQASKETREGKGNGGTKRVGKSRGTTSSMGQGAEWREEVSEGRIWKKEVGE